jgi:riboflavin kinase / FMN adenylyltransferase
MPGAVLTIGNFDGVHRGHRALLGRARELADQRRAPVVALAFDPHPAATLRPGTEPPRLTTFAQRERLLKAAGADEVVQLRPTPDLLGMTPEQFVDQVLSRYSPLAIVEGPDFRFGHNRAGDLTTLATLGRARGFDVHALDPVEVTLSDHTVATASSTLARWLIAHGRVTDAALLLARPYQLEGEVIPGDRRGRTLGFPTANLRTECLAPADGIYAGIGTLPDGRELPGAISVGTKPTFGEHRQTVEAFLLSEPGRPRPGSSSEARSPGRGRPGSPWSPLPGLPEYGWPLRLSFTAWLRDQLRFDSVPDLTAQIERDCARVLSLSAGTAPTPEVLACA